MNLKNKEFRNIFHSKNKSAGSSGACEGEADVLSGLPGPAFVIIGVALCMSLASCVAPHDRYASAPGSVSSSIYTPGHRIASLPGGYRTETISGNTYHYHDGHYYRPGSDGYVVVDAPRRSRFYDDYSRFQSSQQQRATSNRITRLPNGYRTETISGNTYFYNDGNYYRQDGGAYVIVDEVPRNSRYYSDYSSRQQQRVSSINRLPTGYRVVNHGGNTYYQTGDQFYRQQGERYIVVSSPY